MAQIIFQAWLDRVANHVLVDDFAGWADTMGKPIRIISPAGYSEFKDERMLREKFDQWRTLIVIQRLTNMIRVAHDVSFMTDDMIVGAYTTDLLSQGHRIMPRFESSMILSRQTGVWRATELKSGMTVAHRHLIHTNTPRGGPA